MIDFINAISGKHLIVIHKAVETWIGDGDNAKPSGKFKHAGFPHLGFYCTVMVEMKKNVLWDEKNGSGGGKGWKYSLDITDAQGNPTLEGPQGKDALQDDFICFDNLAGMIYPDFKP